MSRQEYDFAKIETKWQERWEESHLFCANKDSDKPKFYCFDFPPTPNGKLHVGHVRNYTIGDVFARFKRMKGFNVLHTTCFDSFGLPNEAEAIKHNSHPKIWTLKYIDLMRDQLLRLGCSYDKSSMFSICDEEYYKWTQWIFLLFLKKGLAYKKKAPVNWCPECQTTLANEQAEDGICWRCNSPVQTKNIEQWFFNVNRYADLLLEDLDKLENWPNNIISSQKNWIGKSEGMDIFFRVEDLKETLSVFTTKPELIYGVTFLALTPEHPLVEKIIKGAGRDKAEKVRDFVHRIINQSRFERIRENREVKGIYTGCNAVNPINNEACPIYLANYVDMEYGTGAVMGTPCHNQRDFKFAEKYHMSQKIVLDDGILINSERFNGLNINEARKNIIEYLEANGWGRKAVYYKDMDWLISRQRYWGTPIPIVYCDACGIVPVPQDELPVRLPENAEFTGEGNPLDFCEEFVNCKCPNCGGPAKRETDTMDTFVGTSWCFLRACSPSYDKFLFHKKALNYWMPIDQAIGGIDGTAFMEYARFITKALRDFGLINFDESIKNLLTHEMVIKDGQKMSKSRGNTVDPDAIINQYGADSVRMFILFVAPPDKKFDWDDTKIKGCFEFLNKVWNMITKNVVNVYSDSSLDMTPEGLSGPQKDLFIGIHQAIKKVILSVENHRYNVAILAIREFFNSIVSFYQNTMKTDYNEIDKAIFSEAVKNFLILLSPFTPHLCEELWERIGMNTMISCQQWPSFNERYLTSDVKTVVVQINSKVQSNISVPVDTTEDEIKELALRDEKINQILINGEIKRCIYAKGKAFDVFNILT